VILVNILAETCNSKTQLSIYCFHSQYTVCNRETFDNMYQAIIRSTSQLSDIQLDMITCCGASITWSSSTLEGKNDLRSKLGTDPERGSASDGPLINSILFIEIASSFWTFFPKNNMYY